MSCQHSTLTSTPGPLRGPWQDDHSQAECRWKYCARCARERAGAPLPELRELDVRKRLWRCDGCGAEAWGFCEVDAREELTDQYSSG